MTANVSVEFLKQWVKDAETVINIERDWSLPNRISIQEYNAKRWVLAELVAAIESGALTAPAEVNAEGWRPIETAPRDGSVLILHTTHGTVDPGFYVDRGFLGGWWQWCEDHDHSQTPIHPAHWMPLPKPPEGK
jgi:hypothetical protein